MKTEARREMYRDYIPMDVLVYILCRLPAECVWRLRSVCKYWQSLIEAPSFFDLHLRRSKERCFGICGCAYNSYYNHRTRFYLIDKKYGKADRIVREELVHPTMTMISCINGVICYDGSDEHIKVCNPVTHEFITIPKPTFFLSQPKEITLYLKFIVIGFDSIAKRYKVLAVNARNQLSFEVEILTLGGRTNCWRKVHVPAVDTCPYFFRDHIYTNGCFYWFTSEYYHKDGSMSRALISFNFAEEKLEYVPLPADIDPGKHVNQLCEVEGCLCLVELNRYGKNETMKLRKLVNSGTQAWIDQNFTLPPFEDIRSVFPISSGVMLVYASNNSCFEIEKYIFYYNEEGQVVKSIEVHGIPDDLHPMQLHSERFLSLRSILAGET